MNNNISEPTQVDISTIEQLDPLKDSSELLEKMRKEKLWEGIRTHLKQSAYFSDEKVKFKDPVNESDVKEKSKSEVKSKTITAIVIIAIMIIISIVVVKKHKRYKKEDLELLSKKSNPSFSIFREIRSSDIGCNALIAGEIFMYLIIILGVAYMLKNITHQANETFS